MQCLIVISSYFQQMLVMMSYQDLYEFIENSIHRYPELLDQLKDKQNPGRRTGDESESKPKWCICGRCRPMPTAIEQKCCRQRQCVTLDRRIRNVVLDSDVLRAAISSRAEDFVDEPVYHNKSMRHVAYRQYVMHQHGHLGAGNRVVVKSCIVWLIRDKYPSPDGEYTGFRRD